MSNLRFERVVSVTNEIEGHLAINILNEEIDPNKNWLCEKGSKKAAIILQMQRPAIISSVHIGNAYSAFVEILVGKAADSSEEFKSLVPVSSLMSPRDSASGINKNCTRLFIKADFSAESLGKVWDRIKVVCSQPFNKQVPFGLCFIRVQVEENSVNLTPNISIGNIIKSKPEDEIQVGSFFKKKKNLDDSLSPLETSSQREKESVLSKPNPESNPDEWKAKSGKKEPKMKLEKTSKPLENEKMKKKESSLRQKRKDESESLNKGSKAKRKRKEEKEKKPFEKLMEDVVIVLSGFQNPLRGSLRNFALEMGADYSPDWNDRCTHLICACENTPKFKQVKGKGKIVRKEWLEKCYADRKRYPWRRFALDKKDLKTPESEDEIEEETRLSSSSRSPETSFTKRLDKLGSGTSKPIKKGDKIANSQEPLQVTVADDEEYGVSTDDDDDGNFNVEDTSDYPMPHLPNFLAGKRFYVDPNLSNRALLERYIVAYDGILCDQLGEKVEFYFADKSSPSLDKVAKKAPNIVVVKPSWIREMNSEQKFTYPESHLIK